MGDRQAERPTLQTFECQNKRLNLYIPRGEVRLLVSGKKGRRVGKGRPALTPQMETPRISQALPWWLVPIPQTTCKSLGVAGCVSPFLSPSFLVHAAKSPHPIQTTAVESDLPPSFRLTGDARHLPLHCSAQMGAPRLGRGGEALQAVRSDCKQARPQSQ